MSKALLYINLGTPEAPEPAPVRAYLNEFLMDPEVIDISYLWRFLLVRGLIVPLRVKKSAEAYRKIWTAQGSPLMIHTLQLRDRLRQRWGGDRRVEIAMRYGQPSISAVMGQMLQEGVRELQVLTAYPQYALSSTETALQEVRKTAALLNCKNIQIQILESYEAQPDFISAYAKNIAARAAAFRPDFYLFSYHGLPLRHLQKLAPSCVGGSCSAQDSNANVKCYRRQCFKTTEHLVQKLGLSHEQYALGFQSRLTEKWIQPFSDEFYRTLPQKGVKRLLVVCPSFTADCLETLEEVALRGRDEFKAHGGEELALVPCLNSDDAWVAAVEKMVQDPTLWRNL